MSMYKLKIAISGIFIFATQPLFAQDLFGPCSVHDAEVIGVVGAVKVTASATGPICTFQIFETSFYGENQICPLDIDDLSDLQIPDRACHLKVGDKVSGILSIDAKENVNLE